MTAASSPKDSGTAHKFRPEATNAGCYFSDCSCGWEGGVHPTRALCKAAWEAHRDGTPKVEPLKPILLFSTPPVSGLL